MQNPCQNDKNPIKKRLPLTDSRLELVTHTGCCSEGSENCSTDRNDDLNEPLKGFFLCHDKPPSVTFIIYPLSFILY